VITPEVIPSDAIRCAKDRVLKYPGIKEDVYVPQFKPNVSAVEGLGVQSSEHVIVLIRPPASEAHYHRPESDELFAAVLNFLGKKLHVKIILLPRNDHQESEIRSKWPSLFSSGQIQIPNRVVDGLNLIWHSDLVISGGGTMNREATALGVPVYSVFRGEIGAVDRYLASAGRLTLIERPEQVESKLVLTKRNRKQMPGCGRDGSLRTIIGHVESILRQIHQ
jgi:uncharacterized protein